MHSLVPGTQTICIHECWLQLDMKRYCQTNNFSVQSLVSFANGQEDTLGDD